MTTSASLFCPRTSGVLVRIGIIGGAVTPTTREGCVLGEAGTTLSKIELIEAGVGGSRQGERRGDNAGLRPRERERGRLRGDNPGLGPRERERERDDAGLDARGERERVGVRDNRGTGSTLVVAAVVAVEGEAAIVVALDIEAAGMSILMESKLTPSASRSTVSIPSKPSEGGNAQARHSSKAAESYVEKCRSRTQYKGLTVAFLKVLSIDRHNNFLITLSLGTTEVHFHIAGG